MVAMAVGENDSKERRIGCRETSYVRKRYGVCVDGIKRKTKIEQNAQPFALQFDACASNFPRSPVYSQSHR